MLQPPFNSLSFTFTGMDQAKGTCSSDGDQGQGSSYCVMFTEHEPQFAYMGQKWIFLKGASILASWLNLTA